MTTSIVDFMRHGEPVGGRRYRGDTIDDPLSEKGWAQMWASTGTFTAWDAIVSSPMRRCLEFAEALSTKCAIPLRVEPAFREVGMGAWEGLTAQEIIDQDPDAYAAFYRDPVYCRPPRCEPLDRFGARVADAFERLIDGMGQGHVLTVAHAGVIRAAVGHVLKAEPIAWYRLRVDNAGITRFRSDDYGWRLEFHNRTSVQS